MVQHRIHVTTIAFTVLMSTGCIQSDQSLKQRNPSEWEQLRKCAILAYHKKHYDYQISTYTEDLIRNNCDPNAKNNEKFSPHQLYRDLGCDTLRKQYQQHGWIYNSDHPNVERTQRKLKNHVHTIQKLKQNKRDKDNLIDDLKSEPGFRLLGLIYYISPYSWFYDNAPDKYVQLLEAEQELEQIEKDLETACKKSVDIDQK